MPNISVASYFVPLFQSYKVSNVKCHFFRFVLWNTSSTQTTLQVSTRDRGNQAHAHFGDKK